MTEKIKKYQTIKFDSFDFLIILILKKKFYRQTDKRNDRQTFGPIEAICRRLKNSPNLQLDIFPPQGDYKTQLNVAKVSSS